jgi:hypothetical protein
MSTGERATTSKGILVRRFGARDRILELVLTEPMNVDCSSHHPVEDLFGDSTGPDKLRHFPPNERQLSPLVCGPLGHFVMVSSWTC